jgi:hypothetical protein
MDAKPGLHLSLPMRLGARHHGHRLTLQGDGTGEIAIGFWRPADSIAWAGPTSWCWSGELCSACDLEVIQALHRLEQNDDATYTGFVQVDAGATFIIHLGIQNDDHLFPN